MTNTRRKGLNVINKLNVKQDSGQRTVAGSCEENSEPSSFIKSERVFAFLEGLCLTELLHKGGPTLNRHESIVDVQQKVRMS
jgi:hypothetical protein